MGVCLFICAIGKLVPLRVEEKSGRREQVNGVCMQTNKVKVSYCSKCVFFFQNKVRTPICCHQ